MRERLEALAIPGAEDARARARAVVLAAFVERESVPPPRRAWRPALAAALTALAAVLAVVTSPGRAVVDRVREVVGVERSAPALFSLPGGGRLLVTSADGTWVVEASGKKRLLAGYREASWSPFGRFVVAARPNELAAVEPDGDVRWTLARRGVRLPRWTGSATDTRIAYVDRSGIRVVAGDGTGDRLIARGERGPLAWRPGSGHVLAYVSASEIRVQDADSGRILARFGRGHVARATKLEWSSDGRRLVVLAGGRVRVYGARGNLLGRNDPAEDWPNVDAGFRPGTHTVLIARRHGAQSTVFDLATGRTVFNGTGVFDELTFSPDGAWLQIGWRTADQWVFVRSGPRRAIRAVSEISSQFRGRPAVEGWCC